MPRSKESALAALTSHINEVNALQHLSADDPGFVRWQMGVVRTLEDTFGRNSTYFANFAQLSWRHRGSMMVHVDEVFTPGATEARYDRPAFTRSLSIASGILQAAYDELQESDLSGVYRGKNTVPEASKIVSILHLIEHKLRKLIREKPAKEREVQDAIEGLFEVADVEFGRESVSIPYSSKTYIPDFTIDHADLAIEVKLCGRDGREKEIISEVNDDILAYKQQYGNLLFIVYDCGFIRDIDRFIGHFEKSESVLVRVVKH